MKSANVRNLEREQFFSGLLGGDFGLIGDDLRIQQALFHFLEGNIQVFLEGMIGLHHRALPGVQLLDPARDQVDQQGFVGDTGKSRVKILKIHEKASVGVHTENQRGGFFGE